MTGDKKSRDTKTIVLTQNEAALIFREGQVELLLPKRPGREHEPLPPHIYGAFIASELFEEAHRDLLDELRRRTDARVYEANKKETLQ